MFMGNKLLISLRTSNITTVIQTTLEMPVLYTV